MVTSTDNELQFGRHTVLLVLITKEHPGESNGKYARRPQREQLQIGYQRFPTQPEGLKNYTNDITA